jgi:hypothetical protein
MKKVLIDKREIDFRKSMDEVVADYPSVSM